MVPMAQRAGQQGSEAVGTGSYHNRYLIFTLIITTENRNTALSPLLCMKIFDTGFYLKPVKIPLRRFSVLWDIQFSTEKCDIPLLCIKLLDAEFFWTTQRIPYEVFWYCKTNNFRQKNMMSSYAWTYSIPELFWNTEQFPYEFFGTVRKSFPWKLMILTRFLLPILPLLPIKIFRHLKFTEAQKCSPTKFFGTVRQKKSAEKS